MKSPLSWNRLPRVTAESVYKLSSMNEDVFQSLPKPFLAFGNGRSYGDVCLTSQGTLLLTRGLDRFIQFDSINGILRCQAGVTLAEILSLVVPMGWFLPATPGTKFATLGGAVSNDVHGKNHHTVGCFGHHVRSLELLRSDGEVLICSNEQNQNYFFATIGGLGLTGLIQWVELQLMPIKNPWMWVESERFNNLHEFWELNRKAESNWPYTVAWIDCVAKGESKGRGIFFSGQHAANQTHYPVFKEGNSRLPFDLPISLVNNLSLKVFNSVYFRKPTKPQGSLTHYSPYFYPLDSVKDWNRIYGREGFYQYQCVIPPDTSRDAISALLDTIAKRNDGSFLAVLKTFGSKPSLGMLSFARPGITLALDFPNRGNKTLRLLNDLDLIVSESGGALYPAKDARMPASLFQSGFPEWELFSHFVDPGFSSEFWKRVTS